NASEMTLGSKWPKEARHFWPSGRSWLYSSSNRSEKSLTSTTTNLSFVGGVQTGAHSSDSRSIVCSTVEEMSERHSLSKYFIRNSRVGEVRICCWTASSAGSSTVCGCKSISVMDCSRTWNLTKPRFLTAKAMAS